MLIIYLWWLGIHRHHDISSEACNNYITVQIIIIQIVSKVSPNYFGRNNVMVTFREEFENYNKSTSTKALEPAGQHNFEYGKGVAYRQLCSAAGEKYFVYNRPNCKSTLWSTTVNSRGKSRHE